MAANDESAVTPFTSAMTAGLEPLSPLGAGSNYHDWEFAIRAIVMGAEYLPVLLRKKEDSLSEAVWTHQNNSLCSLLMRYCHVKKYVFLHPHEGNAAKMWQALKAVEPHFDIIEQLSDCLRSLTANLLTVDEIVCAAIGASLPQDWNAPIAPLNIKI
ncbi:hypothetical protein CROQUDRAFT_105922 [Cronartium quercuum f. sp. fusiforme G11]|uniref:Uncharacterized protein n=1 Tax=Cronartium quercuum f. sp. fusiforme G11 TaxID=708437 RepID=A0A9P6TEX8_9BASI|nr:hypothetical protein CROQUDRAFT_105922 [Cronartium quercuum f. sp. fusiforme G11]